MRIYQTVDAFAFYFIRVLHELGLCFAVQITRKNAHNLCRDTKLRPAELI